MDSNPDESRASNCTATAVGQELEALQYTEDHVMADVEELDRLRKLTPSPAKTELRYDSWDSSEVSMLFVRSGDIKVRDFAYHPNDPRHRGCKLEQKVAPPVLVQVSQTDPAPPPKSRPMKPLPRSKTPRTMVVDSSDVYMKE
ncbi:hypothetical protein B0H11DRAFT_2243161 [Mycena galericulata]|nr:hypothetical protein B0H11DRAFT_2243161 [Mycena galericulata]